MSSENLAKPYQKCNCDCLCKPFNTARFGEEPTFKFSPEVSTKIQEVSSPQVVPENPNPLTTTMLDYIKGEEDFDTTPLESDHIYVKHFKSLIQMRREEVKELQVRIAEVEKDARRYQWIKEQNADLENDSFVVLGHDCTIEEQWQKYWVGSDLDKAIDKAMEKTNE